MFRCLSKFSPRLFFSEKAFLVCCTAAVLAIANETLFSGAAAAEPAKKIVLIAGKITGHGKHSHEYEKNVILLKHLLDTSPNAGNLSVEVHFNGWPDDPTTLEDADAIFLTSDGGDHKETDHPFYVDDRFKVLEKQMARGCGLVQFHWSTFHPSRHHEQITDWVGGYFDYETGPGPRKWYSAIQTWDALATLGTAEHAILRGVSPFKLTEEFYYRIRFRDKDPRLRPILLTQPPGETAAQPVGWAVERVDGGRGFGFTGGHFYKNWWLPDFRRLILNAIVWSAGLEVPAGGVQSQLQDPIRALILTGHNHPAHDWRKVTAALIQVLEQDPRMFVDVSEDIEDLGTSKITDYDMLVMNYSNWDRPGLSEKSKSGFVDYMQRGGGLAVIHFANGAFTDTLPNKQSDWEEYRTKIVRRIWVHGDGQSGHDKLGPFRVDISDVKHPITKGLGSFQTFDELYFRQLGSLPIEPLATARSQVTGNLEPMAFAYEYANGRVFQTVLGHAANSIRLAGALMRRGCVWAAGNEQLSFDPPVEQTTNYLWRNESQWTPEQSLKKADISGKLVEHNRVASLGEGRFGKSLDVRPAGVLAAPKQVYGDLPMTIECWAKLKSKSGFNILVANELKASATHWELYSYTGTGALSFYVPGSRPSEIVSQVDICDGRWHHLAVIYETDRVRLFVDGERVQDQAIKAVSGESLVGNLAIGTLASRQIGCDGFIDEVRISQGIREISEVPVVPFTVDDQTIGLWHFNELIDETWFPDESSIENRVLLTNSLPSDSSSSESPAGLRKVTGHWGEDAIGFRWAEEDGNDGRWNQTDVGPFLASSIATPGSATHKALSIKVGGSDPATICFDTKNLLFRAAWTGGFLRFSPSRYGLINQPAIEGDLQFAWQQEVGAENRSGRYLGHYQHKDRLVLSYELANRQVFETPWTQQADAGIIFTRQIKVAAGAKQILLPVCSLPGGVLQERVLEGRRFLSIQGTDQLVSVTVVGRGADLQTITTNGIGIRVAASERFSEFTIFVHTGSLETLAEAVSESVSSNEILEISELLVPGEERWPGALTTQGEVATATTAFALDTIHIPFDNPYKALMFLSGHDCFSDGQLAVCTVHGDVWTVGGLDESLTQVVWKRFATGLYQPLGLKIVDDHIYVVGKDQITRLHDRDGNGEADFYENFNNDGDTSLGMHDYATCLQTDSKGDFYYARANSGLCRVTKDGQRHEIIATGFRNPFGMSISADDIITVTPQEGEWTPGSCIFEVHPGGYYGYGGPKVTPERPQGYDPPLCWLPRSIDNSSGGQVWIPEQQWGALGGHFLSLSFGRCLMLYGLRETIGDVSQGGVVKLPLEFASGAARGRFNTHDGHLYISGLKGWVSSAVKDGCLQRVRYVGTKTRLPVQFNAHTNGIVIRFAESLDKEAAEDLDNYFVQQWNYRYASTYGSFDYRVSNPAQTGHDDVDVRSVTLLEDGRSVFLEIPDIQPVHQMQIDYLLEFADGAEVQDTIYHTIHTLRETRVEPGPHAATARLGELSEVVKSRLKTGLATTFSQTHNGNVTHDARVSRLPALFVARGGNPTPWLEPGQFEVSLEGYLRLNLPGKYRFKITGNLQATLKINGEPVVLVGAGDSEVKETAVKLRRGFNRLQLRFKASGETDSHMRLLWSSNAFSWELVPAQMLLHDSENLDLMHAEQLRYGRELFGSYHCVSCHGLGSVEERSPRVMPELLQRPPNLSNVGDRLTSSWLISWLMDPRGHDVKSRMPRVLLGNETEVRQQAADLTAFLQQEKKIQGSAIGVSDLKPQIDLGEILFEDLGCISCHHLKKRNEADEFGRRSLHHASAKYQPGRLAEFLEKPRQHYAASRMPDFHLSESEASALESFLRASSEPQQISRGTADDGDAKRGKELFHDRCTTCHDLGNGKTEAAPKLQRRFPAARATGCLASATDPRSLAPHWQFSTVQQSALMAFLASGEASLYRPTTMEVTERFSRQLNCTACHSRDVRSSDLPEVLFEDSVQGHVPPLLPDLTWTGEKLQADWLQEFLAGKHNEVMRPWLKMRMPSFPARSAWLAKGFAAEHGLSVVGEEQPLVNPETVEQGYRLTQKIGGLDCRQCHGLGATPPEGDAKSKIALGINFSHIGSRLRHGYYRHWMLDPLRLDPQTKMPKYSFDGLQTQITDILDGEAEQQFEAIWQYLQAVSNR